MDILIPKNYTQLDIYIKHKNINISKIILNTYNNFINLLKDWNNISNYFDIKNSNVIYFLKNPRKLISKIVAIKLATRRYNINEIELIKIIKDIIDSFNPQNPNIIIYSGKIIPIFYLKYTIYEFNKLIKSQ